MSGKEQKGSRIFLGFDSGSQERSGDGLHLLKWNREGNISTVLSVIVFQQRFGLLYRTSIQYFFWRSSCVKNVMNAGLNFLCKVVIIPSLVSGLENGEKRVGSPYAYGCLQPQH